MTRAHAVATFDAGDKKVNTLVLAGRDIVIPLQEDLDCDPMQDDEVRIRSLDGNHEQVLLASDADAVSDPDSGMIHYRFRDVPPGYYRIAVRIGTQWVDIASDLIVTPRAGWLNGQRLAAEPPAQSFQQRAAGSAEREEDEPPQRLTRHLDLNDRYRLLDSDGDNDGDNDSDDA